MVDSSYSNKIQSYVTGRIICILSLPDAKKAKTLAILRRETANAYKPNPIINPGVWDIVFHNSPEEFHQDTGEEMTKEEKAILLAMTMFAHNPTDPRESKLVSLGSEVARLAPTMEEKSQIGGRFYPILSASDVNEAAYHIRHILKLVKSKTDNLRINYGMLARDLYLLQCDEETASEVTLRWNREFIRQQ